MSFVSLGGDGLRPTFFELVAADRLMPSLKAAVVYSLSVYAQRRPALHRLLDREDELFFLLSVLLDRQALAAGGGSFAEGLYGLRRAPLEVAAPAIGVAAEGGGSGGSRPLSPSQRQMSLVLLVSRSRVVEMCRNAADRWAEEPQRALGALSDASSAFLPTARLPCNCRRWCPSCGPS